MKYKKFGFYSPFFRRFGRAIGFGLLIGSAVVQAQPLKRPFKLPVNDNRLYVQSKFGYTMYGGDTDNNKLSSIVTYLKDRGALFGLELGYRYSKRYEWLNGFVWGSYPKIEPTEYVPDAKDHTRFQLTSMGRMNLNPTANFNTYLLGGLHFLFGHYYDPQTLKRSPNAGVGLVLGAGIERPIGAQISVFVESSLETVLPDDAADSADYGRDFGAIGNPEIGGDNAGYDVLGFFGLGVRYNISQNIDCVPVQIKAVNGPQTLNLNKVGTYVAAISPATEPVTLSWDFGDQRTDQGKLADHRFAEVGTYAVSFSATNCGGTATQSLSVQVIPPISECEPPVVKKIEIVRDGWDGVSVNFGATAEGSLPMSYEWSFGDGNQSGIDRPRYTYPRNGTYNVTLKLKNCGGETTRSELVRISPEIIRESSCTGVDLKPAYFEFGSGHLTEESRRTMGDNVARMRRCLQTCIQLSGYTDHTEAGGIGLAQQRIQSIKAFYVQNGISSARIRSNPVGRPPMSCENEDLEPGCKRNRRVDSTTIRCN